MSKVLVAVATDLSGKVESHAGRAKRWKVFLADKESKSATISWEINLTDSSCLHEWHVNESGSLHPLHSVGVAIAASGGQGVKDRLMERSTELLTTDEENPVQAVNKYLLGDLSYVPKEPCCQS